MTRKKIHNMQTGRETDRETYIDVCKGIGIILMLVGHASPPAFIVKGIYGFHMPLFFIISGMLYDRTKWEQRGLKELVKRRWKTYVIPYFILAFINLLLNVPIEYFSDIRGKELIISTLKHVFWIFYSWGGSGRMPNCTPLWFLLCAFVCNIYLFFLFKIRRRSLQILICSLCSGIAFLFDRFDVIQLPWHLDTALVGVVFMYIGFSIKESKIIDRSSRYDAIFILPCLLGIGSYCVVANSKIGLNKLLLGNIVLMYVGSVSLSVFLLILAHLFIKKNRVLEFYGRNTVMFMAFNYAVNVYSRAIWTKLPVISSFSYTWVHRVFFDIVVLHIMCVIWDRIKKRYPAIGFF